jgi:hypothetical protein
MLPNRDLMPVPASIAMATVRLASRNGKRVGRFREFATGAVGGRSGAAETPQTHVAWKSTGTRKFHHRSITASGSTVSDGGLFTCLDPANGKTSSANGPMRPVNTPPPS